MKIDLTNEYIGDNKWNIFRGNMIVLKAVDIDCITYEERLIIPDYDE